MIVFLSGRAGAECGRAELYDRFDPEGFIEKRIDECREEDIIRDLGETIALTEKGKRIARVYIFLILSLGLRGRSGYKEYFPND
jgi:hypothetical protein